MINIKWIVSKNDISNFYTDLNGVSCKCSNSKVDIDDGIDRTPMQLINSLEFRLSGAKQINVSFFEKGDAVSMLLKYPGGKVHD